MAYARLYTASMASLLLHTMGPSSEPADSHSVLTVLVLVLVLGVLAVDRRSIVYLPRNGNWHSNGHFMLQGHGAYISNRLLMCIFLRVLVCVLKLLLLFGCHIVCPTAVSQLGRIRAKVSGHDL